MKTYKSFFVIVFLGAMALADDEIEGTQNMRLIKTLSDIELRLTRLAIQEAQRVNLNLDDYKLNVYNFGDSYLVIFEEHKAQEKRVRGSLNKIPSFEVEIHYNFEVSRSNFVR